MKDGPKNRLRSQDIHKIVDVFNKQIEIERYSRMVPLAEIADPKNDYNLNIPRYIDSSEPEDLQDLHAHLHGGIPDRDLDALSAYWDAFPQLRGAAVQAEPSRLQRSRPSTSARCSRPSSTHPSSRSSRATPATSTTEWFAAHRDALADIDADTKPERPHRRHQRRPARPLQAGAAARRVRRLRAAHDVLARRHARRRLPRHERRLARSCQAAQGHRGQGPQAHRDAGPRDRLRPQRHEVQDGPHPAGAHRRPLLRRRAGQGR